MWQDYEVMEEIGSGATGVVYRARHRGMGRQVALKVLHSRANDSQAVERFRREAAIAANLDHPNIAPVYEFGEHEGRLFYTMKLIDGPDLSRAGATFRGTPMLPGSSWTKLAVTLATTARALHHAHEKGVLHRDLKPANIVLDSEGKPYLVDFGLARPTDAETSLTLTGVILGTPAYVSPEQAAGRKDLGPATDIWSLGVILYELLADRLPFEGGTPYATLLAIQTQRPVPPRAVNSWVPVDLQAICLRCLEKNPADRYPNAETLADDLERFTRGEPLRYPCRNETPVVRLAQAFGRLSPWMRAAAVLGIAFCSALLVFAFSSQGKTVCRGKSEKGWVLTLLPTTGVSKSRSDDGWLPIWFRYRHRSVFGLNVWTWDGKYFSGAKEPASDSHSDDTPRENALLPFDYQYPQGWFVFGPLLVVGVVTFASPLLSRLRQVARRLPPRIRVAVVPCAVALGSGILVYAFSGQGETTRFVGKHSQTYRDVAGNPVGNYSVDVSFRYRWWQVFGIDVWTWQGEYGRVLNYSAGSKGLDGVILTEPRKEWVSRERAQGDPALHHLAVPEIEGDFPIEYRFPRGRLIVSTLLIVGALAFAAVPSLRRPRQGSIIPRAVVCLGVFVFTCLTLGERFIYLGPHPYLSRVGGGIQVPGSNMPDIGFSYRSVRALGLEVWTWGPEYCLLGWGGTVGRLFPEVARSRGYDRYEATSFEYRYPRGWFVFGPLVVAAALAAVLPWRRIGRVLAPLTPFGTGAGLPIKSEAVPQEPECYLTCSGCGTEIGLELRQAATEVCCPQCGKRQVAPSSLSRRK